MSTTGEMKPSGQTYLSVLIPCYCSQWLKMTYYTSKILENGTVFNHDMRVVTILYRTAHL